MGIFSGAWSLLLGSILALGMAFAIAVLAAGLNKRRRTLPTCSLAKPVDCTPLEFTEICGKTAVDDPSLSVAERASLVNNCLYCCNYLVKRYDYCSFMECKELGHGDYQHCE